MNLFRSRNYTAFSSQGYLIGSGYNADMAVPDCSIVGALLNIIKLATTLLKGVFRLKSLPYYSML